MKNPNIYGLINPLDGNIFYVGATFTKLPVRLSHHCSVVNSKSRVGEIMAERNNLIKDLIDKGLRPEIVLLKSSNTKNVDRHEKLVYEHLKRIGFYLIQDHTKFTYSIQHKKALHPVPAKDKISSKIRKSK